MIELIEFLLRHGYVVLFAFVFFEQIGAPVPTAPVLLAAGALAAHGELSLSIVLLIGVAASLPGDLIWFHLGRRRGRSVLNMICRISLEPDTCVRRTEDIFARHGGNALLIAKFVPGLNTAAPPMAGLLRMSLLRFLAYDVAGAVLWTGAFSGLGFIFSEEVEEVALLLARLGSGAVVLALGGLVCYLLGKYIQRWLFIRRVRVARIAPDELKRRIEDGEALVIVDLRHELELGSEGVRLPGAIHIVPDDIQRRHHEIPRDRDVVLYCTCPNEASSARAAHLLHQQGITRVRPLAGGLEGWRSLGFPLESMNRPVGGSERKSAAPTLMG